MEIINLNSNQDKAIKMATTWYGLGINQVFTISGYAGTGKTLLIHYIIDNLRLNKGDVVLCSFTGKASLVLRKKTKLPASTIHKLIYETTIIETPIYNSNGKLKTIEKKCKTIKKPKLESNIKLIIVDEVSMVSQQIMDDILSFGIPVITLGDDMQLPPIDKTAKFCNYLKNPDILLTEIFRQKVGNSILDVSQMIRDGKKLSYGTYGKNVCVVPKSSITELELNEASQILCGKNITRHSINSQMRNFYFSEVPEVPVVGDKIIFTYNNYACVHRDMFNEFDVPITNGLIGKISSIRMMDVNARCIMLDIVPDFTKCEFNDIVIDLQKFIEYPNYVNLRNSNNLVNDAEYAYAITVHKSQGSQFKNVVVFEEWLGDKEQHKRWLYTAVTRAEEKLMIVRE